MTASEASTREALERIFAPRAIAIVGVPRGLKTGRLFLEALLRPGFKGDVYPVNPNADEILGLKAYPTVSAIDAPIDLAIVVTPPDAAVAVVEDCGRAGVAGAVMFTAGFDELGTPAGEARAAALRSAVARAGVRLIGPNCMGLYVPALGIAPFADMPSEQGDVAFISQSGSLVNFVAREGTARGFAFSKVVSIGNQLDLQAADFLRYFADDAATQLVALYVEGARDGRRLFDALRYAAARKPVVLWKSGRTDGGARAARSHTGSLAGSHEVWTAVIRQSGAVPAKTVHELADLGSTLGEHRGRGGVAQCGSLIRGGKPSVAFFLGIGRSPATSDQSSISLRSYSA